MSMPKITINIKYYFFLSRILLVLCSYSKLLIFNMSFLTPWSAGVILFALYSAHPSCHLSDPVFLAKYYRTEQNDYFFDRDPEIFHCILNYFRSGELHLPTSVCGLVIKSELDFWGIDDISIEECCWSRYATWASTLHVRIEINELAKCFFE